MGGRVEESERKGGKRVRAELGPELSVFVPCPGERGEEVVWWRRVVHFEGKQVGSERKEGSSRWTYEREPL